MEAATAPVSVADPPAPIEGDDELYLEEGGQITFDPGGKQPTSSALRLVGGSIKIEGEFKKGEVLALRLEVQVAEVGFKDQIDGKTGQVVGCERRHRGRIVSVERA